MKAASPGKDARGAVGRRLLGAAASTVDLAFVAAMQLRNRRVRRRSESLSHTERIEALGRVRATYGAPELVDHPEAFFPAPPPVAPNERHVRALPWGAESVELSWPSAFQPFDAAAGAAYVANVPNRTAYARLYGRGAGRPAVIVIHGYMSGQWAVEERAWPLRWLNKQGLDVAIVVLPFHGVRAREGGGAPPFPGANPTVTNEGFRQVVTDLRSLTRILRDRGAPSVGVMGMSLGGYSTALFATVERDLAFAAPLIPLVSVADFARDQGRLGTGERAALEHAALEAANRVVSPLARPSLVPRERVVIVGAEDDRVTPIAHAERLANHFGAPLLRLEGGHLLQTWRGPAFRSIRRMLQRNGIV
jgi:predicted alpha/beta hydrolase family esterase